MPSSNPPLRQPARRHAMRLGVVALGIATASVVVPTATSGASSLDRDLKKLRTCESGGRWSANTGNGYYGAYQFAEGTWHGLGYGGYPNRAKPGRQNDAAMKLHARDGWRPWPACARKEHLR